MIPVGIVSKDRVGYLDVTLRSLSATDIPLGAPITLFDDGSTERATQRYYETNESVDDATEWPDTKTWNDKLGLSIVRSSRPISGIKDRIDVCQLGSASGVVNASCKALRFLFEHHPEAPFVILLQDDVLFKPDWYQRLTDTALEFSLSKPLGILAGIRLNTTLRSREPDAQLVSSRITAQCLCVSRGLFDALQSTFFGEEHQAKKRFDVIFRREAHRAGFWVGCLLPFVCQHIGVQSLVRPKWGWHKKGRSGRIGFHSFPPYAISDRVRRFHH